MSGEGSELDLPTTCPHCGRTVECVYDPMLCYTDIVCPETGVVLAALSDRDLAAASAGVARWVKGLRLRGISHV